MDFVKGSRTRFLAIAILAIMGVFFARLFYIQIIQHEYYTLRGDVEYIKQFTLHAQRGEIYALENDEPVKLVMNETVYSVVADPKVVTDKQKVMDVINRIAGGNTRKDFGKYLDMKNSRYQVLATKISRTQAEMMKKENLAGIRFEAISQRVYPEGQLASQVLGFVDAQGEGKYGFEQFNNTALKGRDGLLETVTDVREIPLTIGDKNINTPAVDGKDTVLSIDRGIQAKVEQTLLAAAERTKAKHVSAIVMDPNTGKVLAMANMPTYDPTNRNVDPAVFNNDTISSPYEPGSDIKTFTVAAGIDKGVITPESTYNNTDYIKVEDITITNASKGQTGDITMQHALTWSLNTGMVTIAQRLGNGTYITRGARDTMYDYFHNRFRLGQLTGIELANEQMGRIVPPTETEGNAVRYSNMAFGQGMDATILQVASGFGALVNGGTYYSPSIIAGTIDETGSFKPAATKPKYADVIAPSSSSTVREMVHQARVAFYGAKDKPGYYIGGKTGTSQAVRNGKYIFSETIGTYLGFGGEVGKNPSYVIMVEISGEDMELNGGDHALPIFTDISNWMIDYLRLTPQG